MNKHLWKKKKKKLKPIKSHTSYRQYHKLLPTLLYMWEADYQRKQRAL